MTQNSFQMISSAVSDRGLSDKRPQNEDSYLEMPEKGLFSVADGVGGAQAGDVASQMAMEILAEAFNNFGDGGDVEDLMGVAISRANGAIYQMSHELAQLSTMATTIVALQISGNIATIGHVGDSRLYRLDARGNLFRETQDHSVVEEEVRAGRMTPEQAENHPSKNVISRALGAEGTVEIDMKTIMFEANTTFLLCSDGITRHISDIEIRELLALPQSPMLICQQMKDICYERGAEDNLTAVIVRLLGDADEIVSDYEENTLASARQPSVNESMASPEFNEDEISTQSLRMPAESPEYSGEILEDPVSEPEDMPAMQSIGETERIRANREEPNLLTIESDSVPYENDEISNGRGGAFGKFVLFLVGLILGGLLGAGGYYYWLSSQPIEDKTPPLDIMESKNIEFESFETTRREIDKNPEQYIKASGSAANDAEDFYLLGRAFLLVKEYQKARESFESAKKNLADYKGEDRAMLQNEIALGYAVAKNELALRILEAEKAPVNLTNKGNTNVSGNVKANTLANTNSNK